MKDTKTKRHFEYKERGDDSYKKRASQKGGKRDGIFKDGFEVFAPKIDANNRIRILPPTWDDADHYGYDVWVHYNIGADNSAYICLSKMKGEDCPIDEEILKIKDDKVYVNKIKAKRKVIVWVIDRKEEDSGPKLWGMPWTMDKNFVLQSTDDETGDVIKIDRPEDGYDVSFDTVKAGAGEGIAYKYEGEKIARKESPIHADPKKMDEWLEYIVENPIPSVLKYQDYGYIKKIYEGGVVSKTTEGDDDDIPDKSTGSKYPKKEEKPDPEETKDIKSDTISWVDLKELDRDDLEDLAKDEADMKPKFIAKLDDDELREEIAEALGIEKKEKEEEDKAPISKLEELKKKYGKK